MGVEMELELGDAGVGIISGVEVGEIVACLAFSAADQRSLISFSTSERVLAYLVAE